MIKKECCINLQRLSACRLIDTSTQQLVSTEIEGHDRMQTANYCMARKAAYHRPTWPVNCWLARGTLSLCVMKIMCKEDASFALANQVLLITHIVAAERWLSIETSRHSAPT